MGRTHIMKRVDHPLLTMSCFQVADVALNVGDCIEYRTLDMLPAEGPRVCAVREIRETGTIVLDDETWLSRPKLTWLKLHQVEFARDTAPSTDADEEDEAAPAPGNAALPSGSRADPTVGAPGPAPAGIPAVCKTCRDCGKPFTGTSNVQKACPDCTHAKVIARARVKRAEKAAAKGTAVTPRADAAVIAARCALLAQWGALRATGLTSLHAAAQLDTPENRAGCRAKNITPDILSYYAHQYKGQIPPPAPGNADLPIGTKADPTVGAPGTSQPQALCDRLIAFADRLGAAEALVHRAERALEILEGTSRPQDPQGEE